MARDDISNLETQIQPAGQKPAGLPPGTVLFGAYEILDRLGAGGMGEVYRARHLRLSGMRAIKVMLPELAGHGDLLQRFYREARALLEVHHDAVVRCHDLLEDEQRVYLVMELIEGISLSERLKQGPLNESDVRALGARLASGLAAAHAAGVVHRDLSPDNIVLPDGRPERAKIIDFGIAKVLRGSDRTVAGGFKGKLSYASPEQLGLHGGEVDARSDLYSLGLLLSAVAVGAPLDMGSQIAESVTVRTAQIGLPHSIPKGLRRQIECLLASDPRDRPLSAEAFLEIWTSGSAGAERGERGRARARFALVAFLALSFGGGAAYLSGLTAIWSGDAGPIIRPHEGAGELRSSPPVAGDFASLHSWLLSAEGSSRDLQPAVWTNPDPVPNGETYRVSLRADCDCAALVFEVDGNEQRIGLLYPNPYEPAQPLTAGHLRELPSSARYVLEAVRGVATDRLRLIVVDGALDFPPAGFGQWQAIPTQSERLRELEALRLSLATARWAAAGTDLSIRP